MYVYVCTYMGWPTKKSKGVGHTINAYVNARNCDVQQIFDGKTQNEIRGGANG